MPPPKRLEVRQIHSGARERRSIYYGAIFVGNYSTLPGVPRSKHNISISQNIKFSYSNTAKYANYSLISMSTPAGKSKRISASTVFGVGSRISIKRL
jgi:hypothetical protein